jgi:hypothetical protein
MISLSKFTLNFNCSFPSLKLIYISQKHVFNFPLSRIFAGPTPFLQETDYQLNRKKEEEEDNLEV